MSNVWTTIDKVKIKYEDLTDSHLVNILKFIKRKSREGIVVFDDMLYGEEVENWYDYEELKELEL